MNGSGSEAFRISMASAKTSTAPVSRPGFSVPGRRFSTRPRIARQYSLFSDSAALHRSGELRPGLKTTWTMPLRSRRWAKRTSP